MKAGFDPLKILVYLFQKVFHFNKLSLIYGEWKYGDNSSTSLASNYRKAARGYGLILYKSINGKYFVFADSHEVPNAVKLKKIVGEFPELIS